MTVKGLSFASLVVLHQTEPGKSEIDHALLKSAEEDPAEDDASDTVPSEIVDSRFSQANGVYQEWSCLLDSDITDQCNGELPMVNFMKGVRQKNE